MILALLGAGMMMGQDSCATEEGKPVAQQDNGSQQDEETVKAEPDGTFRMNCDYLLGDFTEGSETGYKFVAGGRVHNTGNVGVVARVRATWEQLGAEPILEERRVRLKVGRSSELASLVSPVRERSTRINRRGSMPAGST